MQFIALSKEEPHQFSKISHQYKNLYPFFLGCLFLPFCSFPFIKLSDISKYIVIYMIASAGLFLSSRKKEVSIPYLTLVQVYLLLALVGVLLFNYTYHHINFLSAASMERILFWSLFLYYSCSMRKFQKPDKLYLCLALFLGTGLFIIFGFLNFIFNDQFLSFTFHNINKSAEYVGLSLALQLGLLSQVSEKSRKILFCLISGSLSYVYFTNCRSVFLGIAAVIGYLLWSHVIGVKDLFKLSLGSCFFVLIFQMLFRILSVFPTDMTHKWGSTVERWYLIKNTFSLIQDFPWGVGLGRYGNAAASYMKNLPNGAFNEGYYLLSPLNEPLRFLAEDGLVASFLMFLFFASFIFPFHKLKAISDKCPEAVAFFIIFFVECLFQYPLYQPMPLFLVPFILAYTARFTIGLKSFTLPISSWIERGIGVYFSFVTVAIGISWYISFYQIENLALTKRVYGFWKDPILLRNILFMSHVNGNYMEMHDYALKEIERDPQSFVAYRYLGLSYLHKGDLPKGCSYLKSYQAIYAPPSTVDEKIKEFCE